MNQDQVHAVLISVHDDTLLLPNAAVAEVLGRDALRPREGGPDWLLGDCDWNNRKVPVVRFERLNGGSGQGDPRRERVVVLHSLGRHLQGGYLAVVALGHPHLVTLSRAALRPTGLDGSDRDDLVLSRVRIANQVALIPDLDTVEAEISRAQMP